MTLAFALATTLAMELAITYALFLTMPLTISVAMQWNVNRINFNIDICSNYGNNCQGINSGIEPTINFD